MRRSGAEVTVCFGPTVSKYSERRVRHGPAKRYNRLVQNGQPNCASKLHGLHTLHRIADTPSSSLHPAILQILSAIDHNDMTTAPNATTFNSTTSTATDPLATLEFMESVLRLWSCACFLVGAPINTLLLWLIRHRTSKEMKPYARILIQTAVLDLAHVLSFFLYTPVFITTGRASISYGIGMATADSTLSLANRWWNFGLYLYWLTMGTLATATIPAQFYYRHAVMGRMDMSG